VNGGVVQLSKPSESVPKRRTPSGKDSSGNESDEEGEDDEKVPPVAKERESYQKGDKVLVRPHNTSSDRYWIGELLEDISRDKEKVKVWWWMSFHRKKLADNPDSGNWQQGYRRSDEGTEHKTWPRKRKRKGARKAHVDEIWVNAVDIRVTFTSSFHLTASCLKQIHTRVNDWKIAARLAEPDSEDKENPNADPDPNLGSDPNPGFDPDMAWFLQSPPSSFQVDPQTVLTSMCSASSAVLCVACPSGVRASHRCGTCKLAMCIAHFKSHLFFVSHKKIK
jgi:hypothetical protein